MQSLPLKMLFQKKGTASAILAIALLIALLTSVNCLLNNINSQTTALSQLASLGETYLITSKNSNALSDSQLDPILLSQVKNSSNIKYATNQLLVEAKIEFQNQTSSIVARGTDDVKAYLSKNGASINGSACKTDSEANAGIILSNLLGLNKNDDITLTINGASTQLKIVGVTRTQTQSDSQLILPLSTLQNLIDKGTSVSYIEFSVKDPAKSYETISNLTNTLHPDIKIVSTQQTVAFASDVNNQTVTFIGVWSIAIYAVVMAASYTTATRLINESRHDLYIFRTIGATKRHTFSLIFLFVLIISLIGALLGLSVGIFGTQVASTEIRWYFGNTQLAPFLEVSQALQILCFSFICAVMGAIYPAVKGSQIMAGAASA